MILATDIALYAAAAFYVAAALAALLYLRRDAPSLLAWAYGFTTTGMVLLAVVFGLRWAYWQRLPMTTVTDVVNLMTLIASVLILFLVRPASMRAMLSFYLPPLVPLCLIAALLARRDFHQAPRDLSGMFLAVHVGLAFLAYALFLGASITSLAYVFQTQRLKRRQITGLFQKLPSLERLDHVLFRLISFGYPFFVITMILGFVWARLHPELLGDHWWLSPKIALSVVMVVFYALAFHARRRNRLRGPKLAYFVFVGFFVLLATYLVLGVLNLNTYNFWESVS